MVAREIPNLKVSGSIPLLLIFSFSRAVACLTFILSLWLTIFQSLSTTSSMTEVVDSGSTRDWRDVVYGSSVEPEVGQRLGIQFVRASQPTIDVNCNGVSVKYHQESMGIMAISGVVWDAGLLMVDFLVHSHTQGGSDDTGLGYALDIGCGTGIAGITALMLGSPLVLFTDIDRLSSFELNIEEIPEELQGNQQFVSYKWKEGHLPDPFVTHPAASLTSALVSHGQESESKYGDNEKPEGPDAMVWDTVLCSDLLYEEKSHASLLSVLRQLHFKKAIFSYKKRHNAPEMLFFEKLSEWCNIRVVDLSSIPLVNLPRTSLANLYILVAEPK